jgi:acetolactate synthase regulatory subunit
MAVKHNITVAIEPGLLKRARAVAARRGLSVSALLAQELRELVSEDAHYTAASKRAMSLFATPLALGGKPLAREAVHERRLR